MPQKYVNLQWTRDFCFIAGDRNTDSVFFELKMTREMAELHRGLLRLFSIYTRATYKGRCVMDTPQKKDEAIPSNITVAHFKIEGSFYSG